MRFYKLYIGSSSFIFESFARQNFLYRLFFFLDGGGYATRNSWFVMFFVFGFRNTCKVHEYLVAHLFFE